jgi:hypothetical protein
MTQNTRSSPEDRLRAIDDLLERAAERCEKARPQLNEARGLLASLRKDTLRSADLAEATRPSGRGPRPAKTVEYYHVEAIGRAWVLAEYRSTRPQPFRCPKAVPTAVASALAAEQRPLKFDEIRRAAEKQIGHREATYLFRIALRFMIDRGLVAHWQTRFRSAVPDLEAAMAKAWEAAKKATVSGRPIQRPR